MKKFFNFLINIAAMVIAFIIYGIVQQFYFYPLQVRRNFNITSDTIFIVLITVVTFTAALIIFSFYRWQLKRKNDWDFDLKLNLNNKQLLISFWGLALIFAANIVIPMILGLNSSTASNNQKALNEISRQSGRFYGVILVVVAPVFEELIFRGLFFNTFFAKYSVTNKWLGILCSGFIFGVVHDPKFTKYLFIYWTMGSILAWVYTKTRSIRYSVITHMLNNFLAFMAL